MATLNFKAGVKKDDLTEFSRSVLADIANAAGFDLLISETTRSPYQQAVVMYNNLTKWKETPMTLIGSEARQRGLYKPGGKAVVDVFVENNSAKKSRFEIINAMVNKINEQPSAVSTHLVSPKIVNAVDVSYSCIKDRHKFLEAVKRWQPYTIPPNGCHEESYNHCIHLDIYQPSQIA
ncbi:MAG TPA: hypothetical protein VKQ08_12295 [Cyclobacteriaceae bacterium]|nr:hypothetical protein [Cyclobacteriaceae bacterium]